MKSYWITNSDSVTKFIELHSFLALFFYCFLLWLIAIFCMTVAIYEDVWSYFPSWIHLHCVLAHFKQNHSKKKLFLGIEDPFSKDLSGKKIPVCLFLSFNKHELGWISNSMELSRRHFVTGMASTMHIFVFLLLFLIFLPLMHHSKCSLMRNFLVMLTKPISSSILYYEY